MQGKPTIDLKDTFAAEMCIAILRKCGADHEFRNTYWNKVKKCTREQGILLKPVFLNEENWRKLWTSAVTINPMYVIHYVCSSSCQYVLLNT